MTFDRTPGTFPADERLAHFSADQNQMIMSYSLSTLLTRNLQDVFGETDPTRRRAAIDEIFSEDGYSTTPAGAFIVVAARSIASRARSGLLIQTFNIS
jgi:hypothetical protein